MFFFLARKVVGASKCIPIRDYSFPAHLAGYEPPPAIRIVHLCDNDGKFVVLYHNDFPVFFGQSVECCLNWTRSCIFCSMPLYFIFLIPIPGLYPTTSGIDRLMYQRVRDLFLKNNFLALEEDGYRQLASAAILWAARCCISKEILSEEQT